MEILYLTGPNQTQELQDFNDKVADLLEQFAFQLFYPQREFDGDWSDACLAQCVETIKDVKLMVAIFHGSGFDPKTAAEVDAARAKYLNVIGLQNGSETPDAHVEKSCVRVVRVPPHLSEDEHALIDPLLSIINLYF